MIEIKSDLLGEGPDQDAEMDRIRKRWLSPRSKAKAIETKTCFECSSKVTRFKDSESREMYEETGYCQVCQDQMEY